MTFGGVPVNIFVPTITYVGPYWFYHAAVFGVVFHPREKAHEETPLPASNPPGIKRFSLLIQLIT